jgi:bifunctional DNase/RNase
MMRPLRFRRLDRCPSSFAPVAVLEDAERRVEVALDVGPADLIGLRRELHPEAVRLSSIYRTFSETVAELGGEVVRIELDRDEREQTCAFVRVCLAGLSEAIPCPPADVLALALRAKVPIVASEALVEERIRRAVAGGARKRSTTSVVRIRTTRRSA